MTDSDGNDSPVRIRRALISVSDKAGIVEFASKLTGMCVEIVSTGGTKKALKDAGVHVVGVSTFTGAPEILGGRVKTLHPAVHGGILFKRHDPDHVRDAKEQEIRPIDMVVVNLYPFERTAARQGATEIEIVENIDIGGPSMVRSAAKNHQDVCVITNPGQHQIVLDEMLANGGCVSYQTRRRLALEAFELTSRYDTAIASYFRGQAETESNQFPKTIKLEYGLLESLRYGENPHQQAAIYSQIGRVGASLADAQVLAGKELSYNNYNDLEAVLGMLLDFAEPFACVVKHTNPCGAATGSTPEEAYRLAYESDPISAYGSIIGVNRTVDIKTAELLHETPFVECVLAPGYSDDALALMKTKKTRRLLALPTIADGRSSARLSYSFLCGGLLAQSPDSQTVTESDLRVVTKTKPTPEQIKSMLFGFQIVKHVKSNAIVFVRGTQTVGVGCGQTSRVDAVILAAMKAADRSKGAVLASDAFFPMRDGIDKAAEAGVAAIIQPGGSKRDQEAIEAADEHGISMVFTGIRHFRH